MRLGIIGSRYFNDRKYFEDVILEVLEKFNIKVFVSGGTKETNTFIQKFCIRKGFPISIFYPAWEDYGESRLM